METQNKNMESQVKVSINKPFQVVHTAITSYTMYVQYVRACVRRAKFCDLRLYPNIIFIVVVNVIAYYCESIKSIIVFSCESK